MKLPWAGLVASLVVTLVVFGGGFLLGRASVVPDDQELRDSLVALTADVQDYERARVADAAAKDSLNRVIVAKDSFLRIVEADGARWRASAARNQAAANQHGRLADELELAGDTLAACRERRLECADLRRTNADLVKAGSADSMAKDTLRGKVKDYMARVGRDSVRLLEADTLLRRSQRLLVDFEKAAGGCRVPLLAFPCPIALAGYNVSLRKLEGGAVVPFKLGRFRVGASITWSP